MIHIIFIFTILNNRVYETVGEPSGLIDATKSLTSCSQKNPILLQYAANQKDSFLVFSQHLRESSLHRQVYQETFYKGR